MTTKESLIMLTTTGLNNVFFCEKRWKRK